MIVAGFGLRASADLASLHAALALAQQGRAPVTALAAPDDRIAIMTRLAAVLGLPVIAIAADTLRSTPTTTRSPASLLFRGSGSVAEAAALAGAGPDARLIATRHISPDRMATCAIAQGHPA